MSQTLPQVFEPAGGSGIEEVEAGIMDEEDKLAAPCGIYCAICPAFQKEECHGCGCGCGDCLAQGRHSSCAIYRCCVEERGLEDCASCADFPCVPLILFTHDPLRREHLPAMLNLQRRKRFGRAEWLRRERTFWQDGERVAQWSRLQEELKEKWRNWQEGRVNGEEVAGWVDFWRTFRRARSLSGFSPVGDERHR
ncbi:MAG: DUF3795 domain-containing protein [Anaerolineae bacterium]